MVGGVFGAAVSDAENLKQAAVTPDSTWGAVRAKGIPPRLESQMKTDNALNHAAAAADLPSAQTVPLRIAQNDLDLRLLYQRVIDVDLARLELPDRPPRYLPSPVPQPE